MENSKPRFRCPYCRKEIVDLSSAKCPHCGHVMAVKRKLDATGRRERRKKIERIRADAERRKRELGGGAPSLRKGPSFYILLVAGMSLMLFVAIRFSTTPKFADARVTETVRGVNLLAEALGRFRFHTGVYPTSEQGLEALTWIETGRIPGYNGPYLMNRSVPRDCWKRPFVYECQEGVAGGGDAAVPTLLSLGADGVRGTADDIVADPECFYRAGRDTSWTNEWVPYAKRGITIVSPQQKAAILEAERLQKERAAAAAGGAADAPGRKTLESESEDRE